MMRSGKRWSRWASLFSACTVGVLALGFALELRGDPIAINKADPLRITADPGPMAAGQNVIRVRVNYLDDEGTRLRQAGLLHGPLPLASQTSNVAGGSCTFAIDCADGDPCTADSCDIEPGSPLGSGTCIHDDFDQGDVGGCSNGLFCDGVETCGPDTDPGPGVTRVCVDGPNPTCCPGPTAQGAFCNEVFGRCDEDSANVGSQCFTDANCAGGLCNFCLTDCTQLQCNYQSALGKIGDPCEVNSDCVDVDHPSGQCVTGNAACNDGKACNGTETCNGTTKLCVSGTPLCGFGGNCSERRCTGPGTNACESNADCAVGQTCTVFNPVCQFGRCCSVAAEPVCSNLRAANCATQWYSSDAGGYIGTAPCGDEVPSAPGAPQGCPKYSSGIIVTSATDAPTRIQTISPISEATTNVMVGTHNGPLNRVGDDYRIENFLTNPNNHIALDSVRWVGGLLIPNRILIEFWDVDGNFIEDAVLPPLGANVNPAVIVTEFVPRITIPGEGYVTWKIAGNFSPNAQMYLVSTDMVNAGANEVDVGFNDETELWLNGGPVSNFLTPNIGVLAFEITGAKVSTPLGACCTSAGGCQETTEWICVGDLLGVFQSGVGCSECIGGGNAGAACATCNGDGNDFCTNDDDCTGGQLCLPNNAQCTGAGGTCSNNDEDICAANPDCPGIPNQCSNAVQFCTLNSECPFGGTCGGAGTCLFGACQLPGCNVGACCNNGACVDQITQAQCTVLTGNAANFRGFGTTCDEDAGLDAAEQHCCKQPGDTTPLQKCDRTGANCTADSQCLNHNCHDTSACFTSGTCSGGVCVGGGPLAGESCDVDTDCDACTTGPRTGQSCTVAADCRACETGRYTGFSCAIDADCGNCADPSPDPDGRYDEDCDDGLCFSGADNAADAIVHMISVPDAGDAPVTVNITGNNNSATSTAANPDSCWGANDSIGDEPGWFEAFNINKEALVRLDFCCTKPIHEPAWAFISANTDCDVLFGSAPNPYRPQEQAGARGPNYCNEDNLWQWFGQLDAGTYYYPIYSIVSGHVGQYTLHITVEGLPEGACCLAENDPEYGANHCDQSDPDTSGITVTECEARGGFWLGPPNRFPIVGLCSPGVCDVGSCCIGPGDCDDREGVPPAMTRTDCDNLNGQFVTHVMCHGGRCANDITHSCEGAQDCIDAGVGCPGGGNPPPCCQGDPTALDQRNPCPICQYTDDTVCQHDPGEFDGTAYLADRSSTVQPTRIADDVLITSTGTLTHVCVIGIYVNFDGGASDCSVEADFDEVVDNYQVRVYLPESASNYVPGQLLGTYNTIVAENEEDPEYTDGYNFWRHQLELIPGGDPLVQLQANQVYFIEVSNNSQGGPVGCNWYWINAADGEGNNIFYQDLGAFYTAADANTSGATTNGDIALCMNVPFSTPDEPVRACCTGIGVCEDSTLPDCLDAGGTWQFGTLTCPINDACPAADNNQCSNAIQVSDGPFPFDNFGTTTTGETSELCEFAPTATAIGETGELWFQYTATCTGNALFSTCNREYFEDDVVSVYAHSNPANRGLCLCPGDPGFTLLECFDSGQDNPVNPTGCNTFGDQAEVYIPVTAGHCYTVRVSTFDDTAAPTLDNPFPENLGQLRITCGATGETFPVCGNGVIEAANGEQCDGTNADALCNNQCNAECRCPPPPCGNNIAEEALGQRCDGTDDDNCPGLCTEDCTCPPICGNGIKEGNEHCDDTDDALCPGDCNPPGPDGCTCDSTCGNGILEVGEACDGLAADNNCPGACTPPGPGGCQCPEPNCGNGVVEPLNNEECDGAATMELGALCDPAECRPPGDGAGECTCACGIAVVAPDPVTANTFGTCTVGNANCVVGGPACASGTCDTCGQVRSMSFVIPATSAGTDTAVRVKLTSLYDVVPPLPTSGVNPGPALAPFEGQYRYLNLIPGTLSRCCNPASNPTACNTSVTCTSDANCVGLGLNTKCMKNLCPDSPAFATFFRCARLGCTPEYRDWGSDFSGLVTYASGDSVVSDSTYHVAHLAASCAGNEAACGAASAEQMVKTERWGNVDCTTAVVPNATDIGFVVSKVKDAVGAFIKPRTQLREAIPNPLALVGAQDIARIVDAVKGRHYPDSFTIGACP